MAKRISDEQKRLALKLYRKGGVTTTQISNLTNISQPSLVLFFRECFADGTLTPKTSRALKPRTPNGQGKGKYVRVGYNYWRRKHTPEELEKIAEEYYVGGLTVEQLKQKYNMHPMQIQRMRKLWGWKYPKKTEKENKNSENNE